MSEKDKRTAIRNKICDPEKLIKIYNGIDTRKLNFVPKDLARKFIIQRIDLCKEDLANAEKISFVGTIANFYKTKGLDYLIESVNILKTKYYLPNTKFIIIGDGLQRKKIEDLILKYRLTEEIFLMGRIPEAYRFLKAFKMFVLPSIKEGMPWIILETMAARVPILSTRVGAIPEMIENKKEGLIVSPKNPKALSEAISWLLAHEKKAYDMAFKAKKKVKKEFKLNRMLGETERLLFQ